jgi:hypothetical protein
MWRWSLACALSMGCSAAPSPLDATLAPDASHPTDTGVDAPGHDVGAPPADLASMRDRLFATFSDTPCETWASMDASRRAVFLTLTHRLSTSHGPDGTSLLEHVTRIVLILGGGSSGTTCGGAENNRMFFDVDDTLHGWMVDSWNGTTPLADDGGSTWVHSRDAAGPHDPFDASIETDTGLRCTALIFEQPDSAPPTAQAHFFVSAAVPVSRGAGIDLPADPLLVELDQDFNCVHDSNPTCHDFEDRYRAHHGDFECEWVPSVCTPVGTGCYRSAM